MVYEKVIIGNDVDTGDDVVIRNNSVINDNVSIQSKVLVMKNCNIFPNSILCKYDVIKPNSYIRGNDDINRVKLFYVSVKLLLCKVFNKINIFNRGKFNYREE